MVEKQQHLLSGMSQTKRGKEADGTDALCLLRIGDALVVLHYSNRRGTISTPTQAHHEEEEQQVAISLTHSDPPENKQCTQ